MRRLLFLSLSGVLAGGCAAPDATSPPAAQSDEPGLEAALLKAPATATPGATATLDDAILRLVPALGPAGAALGAPLLQLRSSSGGRLDPVLLDATRRQVAALISKLPASSAPDAEALLVSLDILATNAAQR